MKQKILFIASYAKSLIDFRWHLMRAFQNEGYAVFTCAPSDPVVAQQLATAGIQFFPLPMHRTGLNPWRDMIYMYRLYRLMRRIKPDWLLCYTIKPVIYGSFIGRFCNVAKICSMITGTGYAFSNDDLKSRLVGFIAQRLFKFALKHNHKIYFQNPDNRREFLVRGLVNHTQELVLINGSGVDLDYFSPTPFQGTIKFLAKVWANISLRQDR